MFEASEVVSILQQVLEKQEVNWQIVLGLVATYLVCMPQAPQHLEGK
jgi:hypothetical protein